MNHELKTDPEQFDAVRTGSKTFEIRFDDRNFKEGDKLILKKTVYTGEEMEAGSPLMYNGERMEVKVTHVLRGPIDGLRSGWVIMSIETPRGTLAAQPESVNAELLAKLEAVSAGLLSSANNIGYWANRSRYKLRLAAEELAQIARAKGAK